MSCVYDWLNLNCGDLVHTKDDPRHIGRVEAVNVSIKVRWLDNRIISYFQFDERDQLVIWEKTDVELQGGGVTRPKTLAESPRSKLERELKGEGK